MWVADGGIDNSRTLLQENEDLPETGTGQGDFRIGLGLAIWELY